MSYLYLANIQYICCKYIINVYLQAYMCKYNSHISTNIQYNFIQFSTGKLLDAMKTDSDQFMIRSKKKK